MKKRIFALLGDYYHDHDLILDSLKAAIAPMGDHVELQDIGVDNLASALLEKPDLFVLNKENRLNPTDEQIRCWMTPELETQISDYVQQGGSWLAWHAGLASYPEEGPYGLMLKGMFKFHPRVNKPVKYQRRGEPCFLGAPTRFEVIDEHYFVECDQTNTHVFLEAESLDGVSVAGWAHNFGAGRVCCVTPTHRAEGLAHPEMHRLIRESIQWLL
ncbi:ThuA domain-containing protein [Paenibacillus woosongensis]|uniref:ThuA domain-containing protein n=1 Tax=Paenibacillus woosongensis TaxID=307580 RepID=A0AA95L177_9BACL|nr:ThuA domain-containing protein [Paenibacillus woosongensis]WHX49449.1 ThuA domain-containing protein [Paenibacillus woosongensis]